MDKYYSIELRITVDEEELEKYRDIKDMVYSTTQETPFSFYIGNVKELCMIGGE